MAIRGDLRSSSVADVLQLLALGRKSGRLVVSAPGRLGLIELEGGMVVHAALPARPVRLEGLLLRSGVLSRVDAPGCEEDDGSLARHLIEEHPSAAAAIRDCMRSLVEEAVCEIFLWSEGEFEFEPGAGATGRVDGIAFSVDHLLLEAARRADERAEIERALPPGAVPVRVDGPSGVTPALGPAAQRILAAVDGRRGVQEVARQAGMLDFEALRLLADLHREGRLRFEKGTATHTGDAGDHRRLAGALAALGRHRAAHREWSARLAVVPTDHAALFRRAVAALRLGEHRGAARDLMRHIDTVGPTAPALQNLALALEVAGRLEDAHATAEQAARHFPSDPRIVLSLAIVRTKVGDLVGAKAAFEQFDALTPAGRGQPAAYFVHAPIVHAACGDLTRAEALVRAGLRLHPECVDLLIHAGFLAERTGRSAEAEGHYRRALELAPDRAVARRALGDVQWARGERAEAARTYDRVPAGERGAELEYRIGAAFHAVGDQAEAEARWRAALAADTGHLAARRGLGMLRGAAAGEGGR